MGMARRSADAGSRQVGAYNLIRSAAAGLAIAAIGVSTASAGGVAESAHERTEAAIEACWALSEAERDTGVTSDMRHGVVVSARCLEGVFQDEMRGLLADDTLRRLDLPSQIEALRSSYESIYWELYNGGRRNSRDWRGTMYQTFHLGAYTALLEQIIRDVASERDNELPCQICP